VGYRLLWRRWPITEVEVVLDAEVGARPGLAVGWGATLGSVERSAIALALLDAAMLADGDLAEPFLLDEQDRHRRHRRPRDERVRRTPQIAALTPDSRPT
jgi:alpha-D-ribose 1-methylphosphonate 5-triphosphate synthase subunit PhnI